MNDGRVLNRGGELHPPGQRGQRRTSRSNGNPEQFVDRALQYVGPPIAKATARDEKRAPDPAWERYAGRYRNRWGDVQVLLVDDGLLLIEPGHALTQEAASRPELGQTLLAYGRFRMRDDEAAGRALTERALGLFEEIDATGWIAEARAALTPRG